MLQYNFSTLQADGSGNKLYASFALRLATLFTMANPICFIMPAQPVESVAPTYHVGIGFDSTGRVQFYRGATLVATGTTVALVANTWHRIEVEFLVADSGGSLVVRADGVEVYNFSGDTYTSGAVGANSIAWGRIGTSGGPSLNIDDVMIWNSAGAAPNSWLGDFRIETLVPINNGSINNGSSNLGTSNVFAVDEGIGISTNGDTDYVSLDTTGYFDLYQMSDLVSDPTTIHAVSLTTIARSDGPALRKTQMVNRQGSTNYAAGTDQLWYGSTSYSGATQSWMLNPATGAAWTAAEVNAAQMGLTVTQ